MAVAGWGLGWEDWVSADGFTVDPGALGAARDRVDKLAEELTEPRPREAPNAAVFGHGALADAVSEFVDREKRGLSRLADDAAAISDGLTDTINAYIDADDDGASRFGGIG